MCSSVSLAVVTKNFDRLTLKIFSCGRHVGDDVGDDAENGGEADQADDQLKYHIKVFGSGKNAKSAVMLLVYASVQIKWSGPIHLK